MNKQARTASFARSERFSIDALWVAIAFTILVFLMGGSSRADVASAPLLRGAAVLFAAWAMAGLSRDDWSRIRVPLVLLLFLVIWMIAQLIPLPPELWRALPGRDLVSAIDDTLGQADLWRPISLTPSLTWNSLLAMTVPLAALVLTAGVRPENFPRLMLAIVAIACGSAAWGMVQLLSGVGGAAYLYRVTNDGMMVGFFANRNHHALFLACAIVVAAMLLRDELMKKRRSGPVVGALVSATLLLVISTTLVGSRSGLVFGAIAFLAGYVLVVPAMIASAGKAKGSGTAFFASKAWRILAYVFPLMLGGLLAAVLLLSSRISALSRFSGAGLADEMRVQTWQTVSDMIQTYWMLGSGFGSFPGVYKIYEPDALLRPSYFNHAHNDWAELLITGGIPFALIILAALLWVGRIFLGQGVRNLIKGYRGDYRLTVLVVLALLVAGSLIDYPLRVPSIQLLAIMLVMIFYRSSRGRNPAPNGLQAH